MHFPKDLYESVIKDYLPVDGSKISGHVVEIFLEVKWIFQNSEEKQ